MTAAWKCPVAMLKDFGSWLFVLSCTGKIGKSCLIDWEIYEEKLHVNLPFELLL